MSPRKRMTIFRSWIQGTLTEAVLYIASGLSTARQMWKALREVFTQNTKDTECSLIRKLHTCK